MCGPAHTSRRPRETASRSDHAVLAPVLAFSFGLALLVFLLPDLLHLNRNYLLAVESWMARAYAGSLFNGVYHKMFETPRPLWNLFWLLSPKPALLYPVIAVLVGAFAYAFLLLSRQVFRSLIPGAFSALIVTFSYGDYLVAFASGVWILPYLVLALFAIYCYLRRRLLSFSILLFLSGLIRPESWVLAVYFLGLQVWQRRLSLVALLPLLAPILWCLYDWRISGNAFYSFQITRDYAVYSSLQPTSFKEFWLVIGREFAGITGIPILILGLAGLVRGLWHRSLKEVVGNPLLAFMFLPLLFTWLATLRSGIYVMGRLYPVTLSLLAFSAFFIPYVHFTAQAKRGFAISLILPLLVSGLMAPSTLGRLSKNMGDAVSTSVTFDDIAEYLKRTNPDDYRHVFIPMRKYGALYQLLDPRFHGKAISYRELNVKITSSEEFNAYLPALAIWIRFDELGFPPMFQELSKGQTVVVADQQTGTRFRFELLYRTIDEKGFLYEVRPLAEEVRG